MDERQAFEAYFDNQHRRKFPRRGTTGTQEREAYSAFAAGVAYARMTDQPDNRPAAGLVYIPEPKREPIRPTVSASQYPPGTRWMSEDNSVWEIDWDNQDKRYTWVQVTQPTEPPPGWFPLGTHADTTGRVEFSEALDDGGMPKWERLAPGSSVPESPDA